MPLNAQLKKVMVIGSGPIIIGQAAEFDYAGTQACRALREEGLEVVLVNSNPATIMTDTEIADVVYMEPLTVDFLTEVIAKERPDGLLPTLGGQTGLNLAFQLAREGIIDRFGVRLMGTPLESITKAEDRKLFKETMNFIGEKVAPSGIVENVDDALSLASEIGYPVIVRPAYTLGGTGGGIADSPSELSRVAARGLKASIVGQVLIEKSLLGWKEIEYEVMRDSNDNCITVCGMENFDPVGIHTGDSIVVAPIQTLTNRQYQMLRTASLKIIRTLGIEGGCNIQFALDPLSDEYYVIEVNPRVSRSSALASKATGYPIAKVAAKIAAGLTLDEIVNPVTKKTMACFEPTVDYVVMKIPRWPFDKFASADRRLGSQMKATGEVMAIDRTFEGSLNKALRSLEIDNDGLYLPGIENWSGEEIERKLTVPDDERIFALAEFFRRGASLERAHELTRIDPFFLNKLINMVRMEEKIVSSELTRESFREAKRLGFSDRTIARLKGMTEMEVRVARKSLGIVPTYKMVDTCAAEFEALTPYFYSTYEVENESVPSERRKVVVLGSGPIRIGQGVEFDYCSVHALWGLQKEGIETIIINNNPETVSTDFDTGDKLYFEPLTAEDVLNVIEHEQPEAVVAQSGGQTAINLAGPLEAVGVRLLGTPVSAIDAAEDRDKFEVLLSQLKIPCPPGKAVTSLDAARKVAERIGYPVLVRPSYVLGGRAMEIVYDEKDLEAYMTGAVKVSSNHPVLVDKYLSGIEVEVDAVCDGSDVLIAGIMEHVERAGIHSGDSLAVYPAQNLDQSSRRDIEDYTRRLGRGLGIIGVMNIQFVISGGKVYVLEVNPRASRTVPFLSKVTGLRMMDVAVKAMLGESLADQGLKPGIWPEPSYVAVKAPVFSFAKLFGVDTSLGPEMKSTGELIGVGDDFREAVYKIMVSLDFNLPKQGKILASIADRDKMEAVPILKGFSELGYDLYATAATAAILKEAGLGVTPVSKNGGAEIDELIRRGDLCLAINTPSNQRTAGSYGFNLRREVVEHGIPCLTSLDTAKVFLDALRAYRDPARNKVTSLNEYLSSVKGSEQGIA